MTETTHTYRGRFAPSPTGPLHFGSLVAAVASYLQARSQDGAWLVRIEDVDEPRCDSESATQILATLEAFGMGWDENIIYQCQRKAAYQQALAELAGRGMCYDCGCSRKEVMAIAATGIDGHIYPGTCRNGLPEGKTARSVRMHTENSLILFDDLVQGQLSQNLDTEVGDFVIKRADGYFAYQLAVVVDDEEQGITEIVRGSDMLDSTPRQLWLQQQLGYKTPSYAHIPVANNKSGQKLSKQNLAPPLDTHEPRPALIAALEFLNQAPPPDLQYSSIEDIWTWAIKNWKLGNIPATRAIVAR